MNIRPSLRGGNPRLNFLLWLVPLAFFLGGATAQTYTRQNTRIIRGQFDCTYDVAGALTAVRFSGFVQAKRAINNSASTDIIGDDKWTQIDFDLLDSALSNTDVTAAGVTTKVPKIGALVRQLILDRATAQGVP